MIEQCVALTSSPVISDALVEQALEGKHGVTDVCGSAKPVRAELSAQAAANHQRQRDPRGAHGRA
ncbi:hypothetical protein ACNKHS_15430 [Shigella flexneri]